MRDCRFLICGYIQTLTLQISHTHAHYPCISERSGSARHARFARPVLRGRRARRPCSPSRPWSGEPSPTQRLCASWVPLALLCHRKPMHHPHPPVSLTLSVLHAVVMKMWRQLPDVIQFLAPDRFEFMKVRRKRRRRNIRKETGGRQDGEQREISEETQNDKRRYGKIQSISQRRSRTSAGQCGGLNGETVRGGRGKAPGIERGWVGLCKCLCECVSACVCLCVCVCVCVRACLCV